MKLFWSVLILLAGLCCMGLLSIWFCGVGGITLLIKSFQSTPFNAAGIAWGLVRTIFAIPLFWVGIVITGLGITLIVSD